MTEPLKHRIQVNETWATRGGYAVHVTRHGCSLDVVYYREPNEGGEEVAVYAHNGRAYHDRESKLDLVERVHESPKALRGQLDEVKALAGRALDALQSLARLVPECKVGDNVTTDLPKKLTAQVEQMQSELLECAALAMAPFPVKGPVRPGDALYAVRRLREVKEGDLDDVRAAAGLTPNDGVCIVEHVRKLLEGATGREQAQHDLLEQIRAAVGTPVIFHADLPRIVRALAAKAAEPKEAKHSVVHGMRRVLSEIAEVVGAADPGEQLPAKVREMAKRLESQAATIAAYQTENVSLHESVGRGQVAYARACDELASLRGLVASQSRALARWTFSG